MGTDKTSYGMLLLSLPVVSCLISSHLEDVLFDLNPLHKLLKSCCYLVVSSKRYPHNSLLHIAVRELRSGSWRTMKKLNASRCEPVLPTWIADIWL